MRTLLTIALMGAMLCSCDDSDFEKVKKPPQNNEGDKTETPAVSWSERAKEQYDMINRLYKVSGGATAGLYNENYPKKSGDGSASFLWPYDGLVSGIAALHELGYEVGYEDAVSRFESYWRNSGVSAIGGYGSSTNGTTGGGDRFFDDNSIVGIDLVHAYRLTGNPVYIDRASRIVKFLESGEDSVFGGGLWWNESLKNVSGNGDSNKPACANGYATLFLLDYYDVCPQSEKSDVLAFARRLYSWLKENLRDPADGCYWNDKQAGSGSINQMKWTYNTGVMISNGVRLFKITGDQTYLDDAKASAQGSYDYFVRPKAPLALAYPDHDPWFTVKLVDSYLDIEAYFPTASRYIETFINFTEHAWNNARLDSGLFYEDWTGGKAGRAESLLMQAAALEALGNIALYKGESVK